MSILHPTIDPASITLGARFDYYAATVNCDVEGLQALLRQEFGGEWKPEHGAKHGYHHREVLELPDGTRGVTLLHGGNGDLPHVYASGDACDEFVRVIRHYFGERRDPHTGKTVVMHKVSRMDAALDYDDGPGTFDRLYELHKAMAKGIRVEGDPRRRVGKVRTNQMGDWVHGEKGRTFYLGAFKSAVLVRLYEKGIQLREEAHLRGRTRPDLSDNFVRMECQVRPDSLDSKQRAATATPLEAFGYAEWSRELLRRVEGADVARVHIRERRESDHERALNWLAKQYEKHLVQLAADIGGWEAVGQDLRRRIELGEGTPLGQDERPF